MDSDLRAKLVSLGVKPKTSPKAGDLVRVFNAYAVDGTLTVADYTKYVSAVTPLAKETISALRTFAQESADLSKKTLAILDRALQIYGDQAARKDLSPDERRQINEHIFRTVQEARQESRELREFFTKLATGVLGVVVFVLTILFKRKMGGGGPA